MMVKERVTFPKLSLMSTLNYALSKLCLGAANPGTVSPWVFARLHEAHPSCNLSEEKLCNAYSIFFHLSFP